MNGYLFKTKIKLHETDAAGIIFFSNLFKITHDAFEDFLGKIGFSFIDILEKLDFKLVIIRAEADFYCPLRVDDQVLIRLKVEKIAKTSFIIKYNITNMEKKTVGEVKTVHVCIDKKNSRKKPLSNEFSKALKKYL